MINSKEIRIGNIYDRKHGKGWTETVMTEEIIGKIFSDDKEYALDDFEPISLSKDVLKRFGFKLNYINTGTLFQCWDHLLGKNSFSVVNFKQINITPGGMDDGTSGIDIPCQYLHQLQILFPLLNDGTELQEIS